MKNAADTQKLEQLRARIREIEYLKYTLNSTLYWDKSTYMPEKGLSYRSEVMSFLGAQLYERFSAPELRRLVDHFARQKDAPPEIAAMVRRVQSNYIYINKIPREEYRAYISLIAKAEQVWEQAREANDFKRFAPYLEQIVDTFRSFADYWGYEEDPYDALMSFYEPGSTVRQMDRLADELRTFVIDLLQELRTHGKACGEAQEEHFALPLEEQRALSRFVLETVGFDFAAGRLDEGPHPTTLAASPGDVRVITTYQPDDFRSGLFNTLHEGGMGLYEQDIDPALLGMLLGEVASFATELAEARLYENIIGRSAGFWAYLFPRMKKICPSLAVRDGEAMFQAVNQVSPSLIRNDADELTYILHILIRYEVEKDLIGGKLAVADLPEVWRQKYTEYLGITPPNDREGVLQDIQWAAGYMGYFPGYLTSNLMAAQFAAALERELGPLRGLLAAGRFEEIHQWLAQHIHRFGAIYEPGELVRRATGEPLRSTYFINYLRDKYTEVYQLKKR
ncbi:carboxypeptidase M32 [Flavonifractor sp. AGMB03687]|uniref:carboxypeptidase M32 n=1 Tax=Flavonifractor sp. AGMB03687 TaxID=2785133 RepID=UPI001AE0D5B3